MNRVANCVGLVTLATLAVLGHTQHDGQKEDCAAQPYQSGASMLQSSAQAGGIFRSCDPAPAQEGLSLVDYHIESTLRSSRAFSSLHEVVGVGGVVMISLERRPERFNHTSRKLAQIGIVPHRLMATDGTCASSKQLSQGCLLEEDEGTPGWCLAQREKFLSEGGARNKEGTGCQSKIEQAIADSHRRALELAQDRDHEWTAIFEDDSVPVRPKRWNRAFQRAWARVPPTAKVVRLSWCMIAKNPTEATVQTLTDVGDFRLTQWTGFGSDYKAGGCTGAYVVHRSVIPELLALFPCCCAVDCCFEHDLFNRQELESGQTKGEQILVSLDAWGSNVDVGNDEHVRPQFMGIMKQDRGALKSTRI